MRYLGKTNNKKFLVQLNEYEFGNILGLSSSVHIGTDLWNNLEKGSDVEISKIYSEFRLRESFKSENAVLEARTAINKMLKLLSPVEVTIRETAIK